MPTDAPSPVVAGRAPLRVDAPRSPRAPPPARRRRPPAALPALAFALGLVPLAKLVADGLLGRLGANPIAEGLNRLGFWTLTFLTLSLAATPAHDLLGLRWPVRVRRALGLTAFGYGVLHFSWYLGVDKFFDLGEIVVDIGKRPFITIGFTTLVVLAPLALTSTDGWVRRLGYVRWKRLHRLVYVAALLAVVHFLWRVKADHRRPAVFAAIVGALLLARVAVRVRGAARARRAQA